MKLNLKNIFKTNKKQPEEKIMSEKELASLLEKIKKLEENVATALAKSDSNDKRMNDMNDKVLTDISHLKRDVDELKVILKTYQGTITKIIDAVQGLRSYMDPNVQM